MSAATPRYVLKPDPQSSHSIILRWLGAGGGRRALDVGAADGTVSQKLTERGWRVTGIESDPGLAQAGARHCERMIAADLNKEIPEVAGPFDAIVFGDVLEHLIDPLRVLVELDRALAPHGFVVISVPNIAHLYIRLLLLCVMPAYNAGRTLRMTYEELPKDTVSLVILVDDGSTDATLDVARSLGLQIFVHNRNYGYGANQKTCYTEALRAGAEIVVMVHPDYQYDPRLVPQLIEPIVKGTADVVLCSRLKTGSALQGGMPWWKYAANRFLTGLENRVFGLRLTEYHTGYRAFRCDVLEAVNFGANSDGFVFDQEIVAQVMAARFRIAEIAVPTRYFPEASSASFFASVVYGLRILAVLLWYTLHKWGLRRSRRFDNLRARYHKLSD